MILLTLKLFLVCWLTTLTHFLISVSIARFSLLQVHTIDERACCSTILYCQLWKLLWVFNFNHHNQIKILARLSDQQCPNEGNKPHRIWNLAKASSNYIESFHQNAFYLTSEKITHLVFIYKSALRIRI